MLLILLIFGNKKSIISVYNVFGAGVGRLGALPRSIKERDYGLQTVF